MKKTLILLSAALTLLFMFASCSELKDEHNPAWESPHQTDAPSGDKPPAPVTAPEVEPAPDPADSDERETSAPATPQAQTESASQKTDAAPDKAALNVVYLSITGTSGGAAVLPQEAIELAEGETVFDLLLRVTRSKEIHMEFSGKNATAYVKGIDNLYEFDKGEGSGWIVCVNGAVIDSGPGLWKLNAGDIVEWKYTTDLGGDIGACF